MKAKKCKQCGKNFTPERTFQPVCSPGCAIEYAREQNKKKKFKEAKKAKADFRKMDKSHLMKKAQATFNRYVRLRDKDLPCISCGHTGNRQMHAGHYRPIGRNSKHRFDEMNCHSQCSICNNHKSGNLVPYREALVKMYGEEAVTSLENDNEPKKWSIEELQDIIKIYSQKIKEDL